MTTEKKEKHDDKESKENDAGELNLPPGPPTPKPAPTPPPEGKDV